MVSRDNILFEIGGEKQMSSKMILCISTLAFLLVECSAPQRPYRFNLSSSTEEPLQLVSREFTVEGLSPVRIDTQQGTFWTGWEDTGFLYGDGTLVRRYLVVVADKSDPPSVTIRAEVQWCLRGSFSIQADVLTGDCRRMDELQKSHQEDLDALGARLRDALSSHLALTTVNTTPASASSILAVFDVQDASHTISSTLLEQMTELLSVKMTESGRFKTIPHNQIREQLHNQQKESYKQCYDESCQIELGKAVAASKLLTTKILRVGDACTLLSTLYDLKTETSDRAVSVDSPCGDKELLNGMTALAKQLSKR
jgi:hypothetical protein